MATKTIHMVRHGHYETDPEGTTYGELTPLGRLQARHVAKRLLDYPISRIHFSTQLRARQTAETIAEGFPGVPLLPSRLLWEGIPALTASWLRKKGLTRSDLEKDRTRMKRAHARFFRPLAARGDRHELLVCHGNIIRYLVCLSLGLPDPKWLELETYQASLTTLEVESDGSAKLVHFGEVGHIPRAERTFL